MSNYFSTVILAAGSGSRMCLDVTKQKIEIASESVLHRAVRAFTECDFVDEVVVVVREDELEYAREALKDLDKIKAIVIGGESRVISAKNGFEAISSSATFVAIHDAARCFVTKDMIYAVYKDAQRYGAATASTAVGDTVKKISEDGFITETLDRSELRLMQTPQIARVDLYKRALEAADVLDSSITDDNMLLERIHVLPYCTETGKGNIKITVKEDLAYANYLVNGE